MFNYKLIQLIIATFWMLIAFSYLQYFITEWTKAYFLGEFGGGSHKKRSYNSFKVDLPSINSKPNLNVFIAFMSTICISPQCDECSIFEI